MRTEEELRAALLALEREAPAAARVLPKATIPNDNGILPRVTRRRRLAGLTAALGAAAVIGAGVAVVVALLPGTTAGSHPQALPSHQVLRAKLLAALGAAASEIVYDHMEITSSNIATPYLATPDPFLPGLATGTASESWYYPWRAEAGQQVRGRLLTLNPDSTPAQDVGVSYPEPTEFQEVTTASEFTYVDYANHTWSELHDSSGWIADGITGSPLSIWELIHDKSWSVVGRTELDGQPAIELELKSSGQPGYLWVDAQTYRPLREAYTFGGDMAEVGTNGSWHSLDSGQASIVTDYQYLAPTAANLAKLTVPIPPGFRRTA
jgi:hypothetical protein